MTSHERSYILKIFHSQMEKLSTANEVSGLGIRTFENESSQRANTVNADVYTSQLMEINADDTRRNHRKCLRVARPSSCVALFESYKRFWAYFQTD